MSQNAKEKSRERDQSTFDIFILFMTALTLASIALA